MYKHVFVFETEQKMSDEKLRLLKMQFEQATDITRGRSRSWWGNWKLFGNLSEDTSILKATYAMIGTEVRRVIETLM